jgi:hypothetical protein
VLPCYSSEALEFNAVETASDLVKLDGRVPSCLDSHIIEFFCYSAQPPRNNMSHTSQCRVITNFLLDERIILKHCGVILFCGTNPDLEGLSLFTEWEAPARLRFA